MTSEAPKEIWAYPFTGETRQGKWQASDPTAYVGKCPHYTLTTHALAMVAAAYEDAANTCAENTWRHEGSDAYSRGLDRGALDQACSDAAAIRARTQADAQAALDALLRAERVKALREALACVGHVTHGEAREAIFALIEKETSHE